MKRRLLLLLVTMFVTTVSWADVAINETNFPDATFRNWILEQDYGSDGVLTDAEIANVISINVSGTSRFRENISSLKGIEYFTALIELYCEYCQITSLDVSKNTKMTRLYCSNSQIASLDVSGCTALTYLSCNYNWFTSLDVSGCTALTQLVCGNSRLTSLNVSGCAALVYISCSNTSLTSLDLSGCKVLKKLNCYGNQIKGAEMDALVESLPTINGSSMYVMNTMNEGNEMTTTQVAAAKEKGWKTYYYNGEEYAGSEPVAGTVAINETNFPDKQFRDWLLSQDYGSDEIITSEEIATITKINVQGKGIQSLNGIEYFTALTRLNCYNNQITSLDVSKNANLEEIDCGKNMLTSLDISKNTKLTKELRFTENQIASIDLSNNIMLQSLGCAGNQLTSLDISNNTELTDVDCYNNHLTSLDVSKNTKLTYISCHSNQLTSLDFSNNPELEDLYCYNNCLTSLNVTGCSALTYLEIYRNSIYGKSMDAFIESLPKVSNRPLNVVDNQNEGNFMTTTQVAAAKAKGWTPQYAEYPWQEYAGSEPEVLRGDVNGDGKVDMDDATFVTNVILGTEEATKETDVNNDGQVSMPDAMFIVNKILNGKFPDE